MIDIILLEPVVPGNIGAVARVMKNFGFVRLVLINPHCDHLCAEARNRAKHSQDVLENAEVMEFFVINDYDYLVATTALVGTDYNIPRSPVSPSELATKIKRMNPKTKIGLVIGREGNGMFNEEIEQCDFVVTIPSSTVYPTLNVSHAVSVMLYELYKTFSETTSTSHITPIGGSEKDQIISMFEDIFNSMKWETKEKKETQQKLWKKVIGKSLLTKREAYGVMGFLRKVMQGIEAVKVSKKKSDVGKKDVVKNKVVGVKKQQQKPVPKKSLSSNKPIRAISRKGAGAKKIVGTNIVKNKKKQNSPKTKKVQSKNGGSRISSKSKDLKNMTKKRMIVTKKSAVKLRAVKPKTGRTVGKSLAKKSTKR